MDIVVTGIGLRSALGNLNDSWYRLLQGQSAIQFQQPFPAFAALPIALILNQPSLLSDLIPAMTAEALEDAQLSSHSEGWGVVVGSSRGSQGLWEQWVSAPEKLTAQCLDSLPHQAALLTARQLEQVETMRSPTAACATGLWAIRQGCELIQSGQCQQVLAGAVEVPVTPLTLAGFQQMGALAKTGCYPFSAEREGLVLGEGGAILVLESLENAQTRRARIYGCISGWGFTTDACHVSAPASDNQSARRAIQQSLAQAHLHPEQIDLIHAHATSTRLNDQREAALIQEIFPSTVAVTATKGSTGHTLGASGALGVAFSLLSLYHQKISPLVGLKTPIFDLNLVTEEHLHKLENVLCLSFGFGGQNAAIAIKSLV